MVEATYQVKEARKKLYGENGRQPDDEEVAEATGLSMKRLNAVLMTPKAPRSLDQKVGVNMDLKPSVCNLSFSINLYCVIHYFSLKSCMTCVGYLFPGSNCGP